MAKQAKKPAKRVFFVRRNIDDVSAFRNTTTDPQKLLDFYEGEFFGAAGADDDVCNGRSRAFMLGWDAGKEQRQEAVESFEKARDAGRKSAEAREAKIGTSRPNRGLGNSTKARTKGRTDFDDSEPDSEHPSDVSSEPWSDYPEHLDQGPDEGRFSEPDAEHRSEFQNPIQNHPIPGTQEPNSYDGGLKRTLSPKRACAHANDQQQEDLSEDPDEIEDFHSRRRPIHELPRRGYRPGMQTGATA